MELYNVIECGSLARRVVAKQAKPSKKPIVIALLSMLTPKLVKSAPRQWHHYLIDMDWQREHHILALLYLR